MSVKIHRKVRKAVDELSKETTSYRCINVENIAKRAKVDTRTAKVHLDLLQEHGYGTFCDPKRKTFSRKDGR